MLDNITEQMDCGIFAWETMDELGNKKRKKEENERQKSKMKRSDKYDKTLI